jgi:hypothetical protein
MEETIRSGRLFDKARSGPTTDTAGSEMPQR